MIREFLEFFVEKMVIVHKRDIRDTNNNEILVA